MLYILLYLLSLQGTQIADISRDIVIDSEELGRCYVPRSMLVDPEMESAALRTRDPWRLGNQRLKYYSDQLIRLALELLSANYPGKHQSFPAEIRSSIDAIGALFIQNIAGVLQSNPVYQRQAESRKVQKLLKLVHFIYIEHLKQFLI